MKDWILKITFFAIGGAFGLWVGFWCESTRVKVRAEEKRPTYFETFDIEANEDHPSSHAEMIQKYYFTEGETEMLQRIGIAEAGENDPTAILNVMRIIVNRMENEEGLFPDTIEGVLFQKVEGVWQFSSMAPYGGYWKAKPNEASREALKRLEQGENNSMGALFFHSDQIESCWVSRNREKVFSYGGNVFYR